MKKKNNRKIRKLATQKMSKKKPQSTPEKGATSKGEQKLKINLPFEEAIKIAGSPLKTKRPKH